MKGPNHIFQNAVSWLALSAASALSLAASSPCSLVAASLVSRPGSLVPVAASKLAACWLWPVRYSRAGCAAHKARTQAPLEPACEDG